MLDIESQALSYPLIYVSTQLSFWKVLCDICL